jgi:hypothetical protein
MTQRIADHKPERFSEDHIRRYLTPALLSQVPAVELDLEQAAAHAPLIFTLTP